MNIKQAIHKYYGVNLKDFLKNESEIANLNYSKPKYVFNSKNKTIQKQFTHRDFYGNDKVIKARPATAKDIYQDVSGIPAKNLSNHHLMTFPKYSQNLVNLNNELEHDNSNPSQIFDKFKQLRKKHPEVLGSDEFSHTNPHFIKVRDVGRALATDLKHNKNLTPSQKRFLATGGHNLLQQAQAKGAKYLKPDEDYEDSVSIANQICKGHYNARFINTRDVASVLQQERNHAIMNNFHLYDNNPHYNPLIQFRQASPIYDMKYGHVDKDFMDGATPTENQIRQSNRALDIVDKLGNSGSVIHYRKLQPYQHKIYAKDVKDAIKEISSQKDSMKLPNIKHYVNSQNRNQKLSPVEAKNYLIKSANVYGRLAYTKAMNSKVITPRQKRLVKQYQTVTHLRPNAYRMDTPQNDKLWRINMTDNRYHQPYNSILSGVNLIPHSVQLGFDKELMDVNLARGIMNNNISVKQNTLDNINNSSQADIHNPDIITGHRNHFHKLSTKDNKIYNKLSNAYEKSTESTTNNIEYSAPERKYAHKIIQLTTQMEDNSSHNKEESYQSTDKVLTQDDTKKWSKQDKQLFSKNQKIWKQLYNLGVAPIPEYTPGRVQKRNANRIGKMSFIVKHVSEGDFNHSDVQQGMKIAEKRQPGITKQFNQTSKHNIKPVPHLNFESKPRSHGKQRLNLSNGLSR